MITRNSVEGAYPVTTLDKVVNFLDSKRRPVTESERKAGPYPYYGANGVQGAIDGYIFDESLVLLAEDGGHFDNPERGIAYRIAGKTWVNNHAHVLQPKSGLDLAFLCRVLENYDVKPFVTGTTRGKLTKAGASRILIPMPPLPEQRRIAAILDQADALRAKRREALAKLDVLTQSIFIEMFGDRTTNPKGFPKLPIGSVAKISTGSTPSRVEESYYGGEIPWVKTTEVTGEDIWATEENLTEAGFKAIRGKLHPIDSIIVAMYGQGQTRGRSALLKVEATCNQACGVIYPSPDFLPTFMFHQVQLAYGELRALGRGGNQENLNLQLLGAFEILLPSIVLQQTFATQIQVIDDIKAGYCAALAETDALFNSLQHRAFRGEL